MPAYNDLRPESDPDRKDYALVFPNMTVAEKKRTLANLLSLRSALDKEVAQKIADRNLLVASWNIKEFGHTTQRLPESYFYMAEIMSRFDLVVVQEIKTSLKDLKILMKLLGDDWRYLVNDITDGVDGNNERSGYLYDSSRVEFGGLAGEIVLSQKLTAYSTLKQLKRTPYMTGFRAGWKTFAIICVHLHPGKNADDVELRRTEVELLLQAIIDKKEDGQLWNDNLILAGDFNFYDSKDGPTIQLVEDAEYREVESLVGVDTNASQTEAYDRLFLSRDNDYFTVGVKRAEDGQKEEVGGVFDLFDHLFQDGKQATWKQYMLAQYTGSGDLNDPAKLASYFKHPWRKNQLSDHFPIWFELITDSADTFLRELEDAHSG
ncbi:MAG: endonuclease/exonuclease/phosphatase family protein [Planctomycetota bacterium]|jgi:endonuclease/exonuclease/phosphatase family metal-dependent hydrolase